MTASRPGRPTPFGATLLLVVVAVAACAGGLPSSTPPSETAAPATVSIADGPPTALAAVEGGDPVAGQLGTYTWRATGSDSPWLPGSPIRAGTGESLTIRLEPATPVASWTARFVPLGRDGPEGAITLGQGLPPVRLELPPPGSWTVEVSIVFDDEQGTASYAWAVTVQ